MLVAPMSDAIIPQPLFPKHPGDGMPFINTMFEVPRDRLFSIGAAIKVLALHKTVDTLQRLQHDISNCCYLNLKRLMVFRIINHILECGSARILN